MIFTLIPGVPICICFLYCAHPLHYNTENLNNLSLHPTNFSTPQAQK